MNRVLTGESPGRVLDTLQGLDVLLLSLLGL